MGPRTPFDRSANLTFVAPISPNNLCSCEKSIEPPEVESSGKETSISRVHSALSLRYDVCVSATKVEKPDHRHRRLLCARPSGHTAAPLSSVMNSRRLKSNRIRFPTSRTEHQDIELPRSSQRGIHAYSRSDVDCAIARTPVILTDGPKTNAYRAWPIRAIGHAGLSRAPTWRISSSSRSTTTFFCTRRRCS